MTIAGMVVRQRGSQWVGILRCGADTPEAARTMADAFLARRNIAGKWTGTAGGQRMKVGIAGLRQFDVVYRLAAKP